MPPLLGVIPLATKQRISPSTTIEHLPLQGARNIQTQDYYSVKRKLTGVDRRTRVPYNGLSVVLNATTDELMADFHTRSLVEQLSTSS